MDSVSSFTMDATGDTLLPKIELHISCLNLINLDVLSKSDPLVIMYTSDAHGQWKEHSRTEMIKDNLNPKFVRSLVVDYHFEEVQNLKFVCYDIDDEASGDLEKQDLIGEMFCKLSEIITSPAGRFERELVHPRHRESKRGSIVIQFEEVHDQNYTVHMHLTGVKLDKKDFFGKSDPFIVISRVREQGAYVPVYKTEVIKKTLDPKWRPFSVNLQKLCNGDYERPLMFECYDWNRSGKHELIGQFKTCLRELQEKKQYTLMHEELRKKRKGYTGSGTIRVERLDIEKRFSFVDYISGGCEINLVVAVDFTASNGNPQFPNSLHYVSSYEPNEYVRAIMSVGEILIEYDTDKLIPVYGFGAKIPPNGNVSHCFPLNGNFQNPEVQGLQGILDSYRGALSCITLFGPTIFSQILRTTFQTTQHCSQDLQKYIILLILTDGVIDDMEATIDEIVKNNDMPVSIVIVGVGTADFKMMERLDADDSPLVSSNGETARRDIVQFVPFKDFKNLHPSRLAAELLEEIPRQLLSYMQLRNIKPNPQRPLMPGPLRTEPFIPGSNFIPSHTGPFAPEMGAPAGGASFGFNPQHPPPGPYPAQQGGSSGHLGQPPPPSHQPPPYAYGLQSQGHPGANFNQFQQPSQQQQQQPAQPQAAHPQGSAQHQPNLWTPHH